MSECLHRFCVSNLTMHVRVPELQRCCFFIPLRSGILIFGYLNIIFSLLALAYLFVMTELRKSSITNDERLDVMMSTLLFSIFGMAVILNILLLVADSQKDEAMLRLYSFYAVATIVAGFIPTFILVARKQYSDAGAASLAIAMQCYVVVLVRSEVLRLEKIKLDMENETERYSEETIAVEDSVTLL